MFRSPTTIVVGAGASADYGLPLGSGLRNKIADLINIKFGEFGRSLESGDHEIVDCLRRVSQNRGDNGNINKFIGPSRSIAAAMPLALSIDNYLDAHKDDEDTILCGKLAIAKAILIAEHESTLSFDHRNEESFNLTAVQETWIAKFVNALTEGISKSDVQSIFDNVTIISFNYDRCIKHYLKDALKIYYRLDDDSSTNLIKKLKIYHPYGSVGLLPWEQNSGVPFGSTMSGYSLLAISQGIKTFTEQIEDQSLVTQIREEVSKSRQIIFLGFGFHRQNIELITPENIKSCDRIIATAVNVSESDKGVISSLLNDTFCREFDEMAIDLHTGGSTSLFESYWRSITS